MTTEEANLYWTPAREKFGTSEYSGSSLSAARELAAVLGLRYRNAGGWAHIELTPELKRQLVALAGPNTAAIAAIIKARRSENEDRTDLQEVGQADS